MCTVIVRVPDAADEPTRLIAIRDEDPARPWNPLGPWWPDAYPGVVGVRDVRAGGAWLAADGGAGRLAVLLNRADHGALRDDQVVSRGMLALESVEGRSPDAAPRTRGFNLLEVAAASARVVSWDGAERRETVLGPGTHMIAHDEVDDPATARISHWLPAFRAAETADSGAGTGWWAPWLGVLERSAALAATDDRALVRDSTYAGIPSLSLLVCVASVGADAVDVRYADLPAPGTWGPVELRPPALS